MKATFLHHEMGIVTAISCLMLNEKTIGCYEEGLNIYSVLNFAMSYCTYRRFGYERVSLPLGKVSDTPFYIQGDDMVFSPYGDLQEQKAVTAYYTNTKYGGSVSYPLYCRAKPKCSNCFLDKETATAFWLCTAV